MTDMANNQQKALKRVLQVFQAKRLRNTYADLAEKPQFKGLVEFFFTQIYGSQDFGDRNETIKYLHSKSSGILSGEVIESVEKVVELNDLSEALDNLMAEKMIERGVGTDFDQSQYAEIYRSCDNYEQRVAQIELMLEASKHIHAVSQMWMIGLTLKTVNKLAYITGYGHITDFLAGGYNAFHSVKNIDFFLQTVKERETVLNDALFQRG